MEYSLQDLQAKSEIAWKNYNETKNIHFLKEVEKYNELRAEILRQSFPKLEKALGLSINRKIYE